MKSILSTVLFALLVVLVRMTPISKQIYLSPGTDLEKDVYEGEEGPYFEGDMMLSTEEVDQLLTNKMSTTNTRKWDFKELMYYVDPDFTAEQKKGIKAGIDMLASNLSNCITFVELLNHPPPMLKTNYVFVNNKQSVCASDVGMQGGQQNLHLGDEFCFYPGRVAHEFIHALGFYHEQSRPDREDHVRFIEENVNNSEHNYNGNFYMFNKEGSEYKLPYNLGSIMHYGLDYFGKVVNGITLNTLELVNPDDALKYKIGQRDAPTYYDIEMIKLKYECQSGADCTPPRGPGNFCVKGP